MKKFLFPFIFLILISASLFSQDKKHTAYVDLYPMFTGFYSDVFSLGVGYDHNINEYFSIGNYNYFYIPIKPNAISGYNFTINGKYYPIRTKIGTPFIDLGIGYRRVESEEDNIHSMTGLANIGFKFIFGKGLVLVPGFGVRYNLITFSGSEKMNLGTYVKAIVGWTF